MIQVARQAVAAAAATLIALSPPAAGQEPSAPATKARPAAQRATLREIRREVLPDVVRVTIVLDAEVTFHDERLDGPSRVFLDLRSTRAAPPLTDGTLRFDGDSAPVRQIRLGRHPDGTTRVVLEAADVAAYNVYQLYNPYRLVVDCARLQGPPSVHPAAAVAAETPVVPAVPRVLVSRPLAGLWARTTPFDSRGGGSQIRDALATLPVVQPDQAITVSDAQADTSPRSVAPTAGSYSVARQLGLGVSRIVIDPGHGGHDPGAQYGGTSEAEIVLDVALRLEKLLSKDGGTEVTLTRRTDDFVPLQERTAIANREEANLFLSIHGNANASPNVRGLETYFLNFASNLSAAAVAARENAASGQSMGALPDLVKTIALNNKLDESREFATLVQSAMVEKLRATNKTVKDLGVKQAPFVVLIGAAMPSVLAEISFVTNPQEAKLLKTSAYRQRIADALFNAIRKYQTSLRNVATVAARKSQ